MLKLRNTGTVSISTGTIAASGSYTTEAMDCAGLEGFFSLQWLVVGDGTMKAEVLVSNDGDTFFDIDDDIASGKTAGSGMAAFDVTVCNFMRLKFTETGTSESIAVTGRLRAK